MEHTKFNFTTRNPTNENTIFFRYAYNTCNWYKQTKCRQKNTLYTFQLYSSRVCNISVAWRLYREIGIFLKIAFKNPCVVLTLGTSIVFSLRGIKLIYRSLKCTIILSDRVSNFFCSKLFTPENPTYEFHQYDRLREPRKKF